MKKSRILLLSLLFCTFAHAELPQLNAFKQKYNKQLIGQNIALNNLFNDVGMDGSQKELFTLIQPVLEQFSISLFGVLLTVHTVKDIKDGYQIEGTISTKLGALRVAFRVVDVKDKLEYAFALRPQKPSTNFSLKSVLESPVIKALVPFGTDSIFSKIVSTIDKYIVISDPSIVFSTIPGIITESILGLSNISKGLSLLAYIPDGDCVLCKGKIKSGFDKLGFTITVAKKPKSYHDIKIAPMFSLKSGSGICILGLLTQVIEEILKDIGANNDGLQALINALSFCLYSSIGIIFDENNNMLFYAVGQPKAGNKELGKYGMVKILLSDNFPFAGGLWLGDNIAMSSDGLKDKGFAAKFGEKIIQLINQNFEFSMPFLSITNSDKPTAIFDLDPVCKRFIDPDPAKREKQKRELEECREYKRQELEGKITSLTKIPEIPPPPPPIDFDFDFLDSEEESTSAPEPTKELTEQEKEQQKKELIEKENQEKAERIKKEQKLKEELKKLDEKFDFDLIRTIDPGIIFDLNIKTTGSLLKPLLEPLNLSKGRLRLSIPIKKCLKPTDIKVTLTPEKILPIKLTDLLDPALSALPDEMPLAKDLKGLQFVPRIITLDANIKGIVIVVTGKLTGSKFLGDIDIELYRQPDKTVAAISIKETPNFATFFGTTFEPFFDRLTKQFTLSDTMIILANLSDEAKKKTSQMTLFGKPHTIKDGLSIHTVAHTTSQTPPLVAEALAKAHIKDINIDIRSFKASPDSPRTMHAEIFAANQLSPTAQVTTKDAQTCPIKGKEPVKFNPALMEEDAPKPAQLCPFTLISEILSPLKVDQLLNKIDPGLCMGVRILYTHEEGKSLFAINGYSEEQQAYFNYKLTCTPGSECKKSFGITFKSLELPGTDLTLNNPVLSYTEQPNTTLFDFDKTTLSPDAKSKALKTVPTGLNITFDKLCPLKLITSTGIDLGSLVDEVCVSGTMSVKKEADKTIFIASGTTPDKQTEYQFKLACPTGGACAKTFGIKRSIIKLPVIGDVKNPVILYTSATSDTIFDRTAQKGLSIDAVFPETWQLPDAIKKFITSMRISFVDSKPAINLVYSDQATLCLKDFSSDIPINACFKPTKMTYSPPRSFEMDATLDLLGVTAPLKFVFSDQKTYLVIIPKQFGLKDLPAPLNLIDQVISIENPVFGYADKETKTNVKNIAGKEITLPSGFNLIGTIKLKPPFDEVLKFLQITELTTAIPLTASKIDIEQKQEKDLGILVLHAFHLTIDPTKTPIAVGFALDATLKFGDVRTMMEISMSAGTTTISGQVKCIDKTCKGLENPFGIPITITPIPPDSENCPCIDKDATCNSCKAKGMPLSFTISLAGGVPTGLGASGLFALDDQSMVVNFYANAKEPTKFGFTFESKKMCLLSMISLLYKFTTQGFKLPEIPDILCLKNVKARFATLPITINGVRMQPGVLMKGEFDLLGLSGLLGVCVRVPIFGTDKGPSEVKDPEYDICKSSDPSTQYGVFAKGIINPLKLNFGNNRPFLTLTRSAQAKDAKGASIDLEFSNARQQVVVNGRLVILPESANSIEGLLANDMNLELKVGEGIFRGSIDSKFGGSDAHIDASINLKSPLDSLVVITIKKMGFKQVLELIPKLIGGDFKLPPIPDIGINIDILRISIGKDPISGFGLNIHAEANYFGQNIILDGSIDESGLILKGRLTPVKFLGTDQVLYIVDATDPQKGPVIDVEFTKTPTVKISGKALFLKSVGGDGLISTETTIWTRQFIEKNMPTVRSDFILKGNLAGFTTEFNMASIIPQNLSDIKWTVEGKIKDNLTDTIMRGINTVLGPIKSGAETVYKGSVGTVQDINDKCHEIPVIADLLCAPLDVAVGTLETAGVILEKIMKLGGPDMFHIKQITFKADLANFLNITSVNDIKLPSVSVDFVLLDKDNNLSFTNITLPTLPQKLVESMISLVKSVVLDGLLKELGDIGTQIANIFANVLKGLAEAAGKLAMKLFEGAADIAKEGFKLAEQGAQAVAEFGQKAINAIGDEVKKMAAAVQEALQKIDQALQEIGKQLIKVTQEVAQAIQGAVKAVGDAINAVGNAVNNALKNIQDALASIAKTFCFGIFC